MKAGEVKRLLGVTQKTLNVYIKQGKLHPFVVNSHHYEYDENEVYSMIGKKVRERKVVTYSRVSLRKQKNDLESQTKRLYDWSISNGYKVDEQLSDIKSGMSFNDRKDFCKLVKMVSNYEVSVVIVENRDRLTRFAFELLEMLFKSYGTEIIVISNVDNKVYEKEMIDDLISIIHDYSMKTYSMRKKLNNAINVIKDSSDK